MATIAEALAIGLGHLQAGRLLEAEQIYLRILAVAPRHPDALHLLGVIALQAGKHEAAAAYLESAAKLLENDALCHFHLGNAYFGLRKVAEAIDCFQRALTLQPTLAEAHFNIGNALKAQGRVFESIACYQRAGQARPGYIDAD